MVGKQPYPNFCSHRPSVAAASSPPSREKSTCCSKVAEFACSACMLCVCCPISMAWCCVRTPCKIGWRLAQKAKCGGVSCCGSRRVSSATYSSFSDMDADDHTSPDPHNNRVSCRRSKVN